MAADSIWLDVLPALGKFGPQLTKGTTAAAQDAGKSAGATWSRQFSSAAGDGGTKAVVAELEAAAKQTERAVAEQTGKIQAARAQEREASAKTVLAEQALADARAKHGDSSAQARAAELRLEAARDRSARASGNTERAEESLRAAKRESREITQQLEAATKQLGDEVEDQPSAWSRMGAAVSSAKDDLTGAQSSLGDMVAGLGVAAGAVATFGAAWANNLDLDSGTANVAASLGLTEAQSQAAGAAAGALYADAYGDSMTDVTGAVESVMSSISGLRDASAADLQDITAQALNVASAFDLDVSEAATAAGTLISNGLAPDATGAFDLITASLQKVPEALRGDALDAVTEYGGVFAGLGLDGSTAMGMLVAASDGGAIAIDKVGDSLKEFTIRATDMSTATTSAYDTLGLDTQEMTEALLAGGDSASGAMQTIVDALLSVEDPAVQANTAIALFGTPLEDLNVTEIPSFLSGLSEMDSSLGDVTGAAAAMGDTLNSDVATSWESVKRGVLDLVSQGLQPFLDVAAPVLAWALETPGVLSAVGIGLGVLAAAWGVYTIAQWAANSAMLASPLTWIIVGVAALAAGIVLAVQNWGAISDWIAEKWEPIGAWFVGLWDGIKSGVASVGAWFSSVWDSITTGVATALGWFESNVVPVFEAVWGGVTAAVEVAGTVLQVVWVSILTGWQLLMDAFSWAWDNLGAPVFNRMKADIATVWDFIQLYVFAPLKAGWEAVGAGFAWVKDNVITPAVDGFKLGLSAAWSFIQTSVFAPLKAGWVAVGAGFAWVKDNVISPAVDGFKLGLSAAWSFIQTSVFAPLKAGWEAVGAGFTWVKTNVIDTAWQGLQTLLQTGWSWVETNVFDPFKRGVDAIGTTFTVTKDLIGVVWDEVKAAAAKPVNFIIETVYRDGIKKTWDSIASSVGLDLALPNVSPIKFADGGVTPGYTPRQDVHHYWSPTGGALSLSGGEAIMVPEWTRAVGGPGAVARMNAAARSGQAFADGGVFGTVGSWISNAASNVSAIAGQIAEFLADPVAGVRNLIAAPMEEILAQVGGGQLGQLLVELPRTVVAGIIDSAKDLFSDAMPKVVGSLAKGAWTSPSRGPITSRYGPRWGAFHAGDDIAGGGRVYAPAAGRVVDVGWNILSGRTGVGVLLDHGGQIWSYTGHHPVGGPKVAAGQMVMMGDHIGYQGATGNVTGVHTHLEVHRGRIGSTVDPSAFFNARGVTLGSTPKVPGGGGLAPRLMDTGGAVRPGFNLIENRTGQDELLLNPEQMNALGGMLGGRGRRGTDRPLHIHTNAPLTPAKLVEVTAHADLLDAAAGTE